MIDIEIVVLCIVLYCNVLYCLRLDLSFWGDEFRFIGLSPVPDFFHTLFSTKMFRICILRLLKFSNQNFFQTTLRSDVKPVYLKNFSRPLIFFTSDIDSIPTLTTFKTKSKLVRRNCPTTMFDNTVRQKRNFNKRQI